MEEQGVVVELKGTAAVVRMTEAGGCSSCASSGACKAAAGGRLLEALNTAGAKVGDSVAVEIAGGSFLKASFVVYMVPVILLFIGAYLGGEYGPAISGGMTVDSWQAVGGASFLALSIIALRLYDRMVNKSGRPGAVVTRIIKSARRDVE